MKLTVLPNQHGEKQYENIVFYAKGGMSEIYLADDISNHRKVIIKTIRITDEQYRLLLQQEFRIASSIKHTNVVETYDFGECSDETGEYFYCAMEYLPAGNLRQLVKQSNAQLSITTCLNYFYNLLEGLKEAHKVVIHRDLKPENILVSKNGVLKICDFGIAKYVDQITRTNTFKGAGTLPYMAPECWSHDVNTKQMDIYALGLIFFEILTGRRAFEGKSENEYKNLHLYENAPLAVEHRRDTPVSISEIIRKMTEKKTSERYKDVSEIINEFNRYVISEPEVNQIDVQNIIGNVHRKIATATEERLKREKEETERLERQRLQNYSVNRLYDIFRRVADSVNNSPIDEKVKYSKTLSESNASRSSFNLAFSNKSLEVSFYAEDTILQYISSRKKELIDLQVRKYGFIMQEPETEYIELDNAILLGKVQTSIAFEGRKLGFNIMLRKSNSSDIYGEWYYCKFHFHSYFSNVPAPDFYFYIDPTDFFKQYQFGRQRTNDKIDMTHGIIQEADVIDLLHRMSL